MGTRLMGAPNKQADKRRRRMLQAMLAGLAWPLAGPGARAATPADRVGAPLAPWQPGCLDIHHIATGRGNATLVLLPDGTSLLIDAGASNNGVDVSVATRPNASRRAGEWIGRYCARQLRAAGLSALDYVLVTHLHPDHLGDVDDASPLADGGAYRLTGVTDVAALLEIGTLIDRGYPAYDYPSVWKAPFADNYRAYVAARVAAGQRVEPFKVGSDSQIGPRGHRPVPVPVTAPATAAAPFSVRNLAANGVVWTGTGSQTVNKFPALAALPAADRPTENSCSTAIRIGYGKFAYFTAGDLTSYTEDGALPWRDMLGPAAHAAGPVSVATADHHGMFDGLNADVVRTLRPKAWVVPSWHIVHPDMLQLERMFSERLYPGPRDVFATTLMAGNMLANGRLTSRMRSHDGHIVVRVQPGGERFHIAVTDNGTEDDRVTLLTGPYEA